MTIEPIARLYNNLPEKFGVPRQSGLIPELQSSIVFYPQYRQSDALRGLESFSHIWLLWDFSMCHTSHDGSFEWQPTVRPPRLGGNTQMGVFATRSPFRPNNIGLSCVKIESIELHSPQGPVINVSGADLMNDTPIYDIKPYLRFTDSHPEATSGFVDQIDKPVLDVHFPKELLNLIPAAEHDTVIHLLAQDPRPAYQHDPDRIYGLSYAQNDILFRVAGNNLTVTEIKKRLQL